MAKDKTIEYEGFGELGLNLSKEKVTKRMVKYSVNDEDAIVAVYLSKDLFDDEDNVFPESIEVTIKA